jgi:hypothetical protein
MAASGRVDPLRRSVKFTPDPDKRGLRYAVPADEQFVTTTELARFLGMHPETVWRWCRKWFGPLPPGRAGREMGYRIPPVYVKVARVWLLVEDAELRELARKALVEGGERDNYVVVVANDAFTCYSWSQALERLESLLEAGLFRHMTIIYVGDGETEEG